MEHQNGSIVTEGMKEEAESIKNEANAYFKGRYRCVWGVCVEEGCGLTHIVFVVVACFREAL